jgi:6,7-dimethyl-8-ribityllumazine synthase
VPDFSGRLRASGRVGILVSRYNEVITSRLLEGALSCCSEARIARDAIDVVWTPGAFELPVAAAAAAEMRAYFCLVALGVVVRGDTPHFEYVAGAAARGLQEVAVRYRLPIGFGVLTVESMDQARDRAGGGAGNKGHEAAAAALRTADVLEQLRSRHAAD